MYLYAIASVASHITDTHQKIGHKGPQSAQILIKGSATTHLIQHKSSNKRQRLAPCPIPSMGLVYLPT